MQQHSLAADFSPLTAMLQSLGQPLNQLLNSQLSGARALKGVDGRLTTSLDAESRVLLSQCGTWGDPGTADSGWVFFLQEASIKTTHRRHVRARKTIGCPNAWLGYRGATIGPYGSLSQLTGLDHRTLLPPYLPAGRGEDLLFAVMLQAASPRVCGLQRGLGCAPLTLLKTDHLETSYRQLALALQ